MRIHLEEDVAKSFHYDTSTGIDFNRAGTPLMEIVTQPEIDSPEEAFAFLSSLRQILLYGGVSDADMEKGQMRCDCNVSVRPEGQKEFGAKIEIKNMNSVSGVRKALAYEIVRQTAELEAGRTLQQETRRWDDPSGQTFLMRTKENAHDYRYFPDPDLMPVRTETLVARRAPRCPNCPPPSARVLSINTASAPTTPPCSPTTRTSRRISRPPPRRPPNPRPSPIGCSTICSARSARPARPSTDCPLPPAALTELVDLIDAGKISNKQGKEVFAEMFASGKPAAAIVKEKGLEQLSDTGALEALVRSGHRRQSEARGRLQGGQPRAAQLSERPGHEALQGSGQPGGDQRDSATQAGGVSGGGSFDSTVFALRRLVARRPGLANGSVAVAVAGERAARSLRAAKTVR